MASSWANPALGCALMLVAVGVSGCFDGSGEDPKGAAEELQDAIDEGAGLNQTPMLAVIEVSIDGEIVDPDNGTPSAAVGVNVTFDGSSSVGDNLTYAWNFGDNATSNETMATHAFSTAGFFNVTLTVSSGNESAAGFVVMNITAGGPKPGDLVWTDNKHRFTGSLTLGNPNTATSAGVDYQDHVVQVMGGSPDGIAAQAQKVRVVLDGSGAAAVDMYVYWRSPTGANLASATTPMGPDKSFTYSGNMPPGNYVVRVRLFAGAMATYTVSAELSYYAT